MLANGYVRTYCVACGVAVQVTQFRQQLLGKRRAANTAERVGRRVLAELMPELPLQGWSRGSEQLQSACTLSALLEEAKQKVKAAGRHRQREAVFLFFSVPRKQACA
jgi:hypothetical protein